MSGDGLFSRPPQKKEQRERERIRRAIVKRFEASEAFATCARCNQKYQLVEAIGRRDCTMHPEVPNGFANSDPDSPDCRLWPSRFRCCGSPSMVTGQTCKDPFHKRYASRGCTRCEHTSREQHWRLPNSPETLGFLPPQELAPDALRDDDPFNDIVRVEPIFFLRALAEKRGLSLDQKGGLYKLLDGAHAYVAVSPDDVASGTQERVAIFSIGHGCRINVPLRSAYVRMLSRYGLPCGLLKQRTLAKTSQGTAISASGTGILDALADVARSFALPRRNDSLARHGEGGDWRGVMNERACKTEASALQRRGRDMYYDAHPFLAADGSRLQETSQSPLSNTSLLPTQNVAQLLASELSAPGPNVERFYPFCVWLTCDALPRQFQ